ncbi:MAG: hypothetical protein HKN12_03900 [Gemmatimonadetes bacterium]|nr:hypothetical protein [Gemmatimonadota bacterium]
MPFVTIREILHKVEGFHEEFGTRLQAAEKTATNSEAKMVLGFLGNHQRELAGLLATMDKESPETISTLNEWVQFDTEVEDPREFLRGFSVESDWSSREVVEAANKLDVCLFCLYKGLAKGSSTPKAQRLFARLARMEMDHQKARQTNQGYY